MNRGKKEGTDKEKPSTGGGELSGLALEELLGPEEEEPTRHVQFDVPPGVKPLIVDDLAGKTSPRPEPQQAQIGVEAIFENLEIGPEDSMEIPVHDISPPKSADQSPPAGQAKATTPVPASRFARGFTAGRMPLDGSEFVEDRKPAKKKTPLVSTMPPASLPPMDENLRITKSGFLRSITFRDMLLLLLVLVLAAALWLAWHMFEKFNTRQEMQRLELQRQELEQKKSSVYQDGKKAKK